MENRTELFAFFGFTLLLFIASLGFYFTKTVEPLSLSSTNLEECNTLISNEEGVINTVFFSTKEQAEEYSNYLLNSLPFTDYKKAFNFYYITPEQYSPECEIYKGIAALCYNSELIKKSASCPNDFIVVIDKQSINIRSSAYLNVMSLNSKHSLNVYLHEFGHSFANLAEEYVPARIPRGSENCQRSCEDFDGEINGCYQECSNSDYYRTIESGVMRTLFSSEFGVFNSRNIIEIIESKYSESSITGAAISEEIECSQQKYFLIEVQNINGEIQILDKSIQIGCSPSSSGFNSDFTYKIFTEEKRLILEDSRNLNIFTDIQFENNEEISGETFNAIEEGEVFFIISPYIEQASRLEIINENSGESTELSLRDLGGEVACKL